MSHADIEGVTTTLRRDHDYWNWGCTFPDSDREAWQARSCLAWPALLIVAENFASQSATAASLRLF
jgi:hypothetical protein